MSKPVNKTAIGIFVVVALALIIGGIIVIGSGKFFKNNQKFVLYFDGSVKGLSEGSPVVFRGVRVGSVKEIRMRYAPKNRTTVIPVIVEFGEGKIEGMEAKVTYYNRKKMQREFIESMISEGLRAQLEMQSIVTGQLQISLDFVPDKPARMVNTDPQYVEIPTIPTTLQEFTNRVQRIPFEEIFEKLRGVAEGMEKIVNSPEMTRLFKSLAKGTENIGPLGEELKEAASEIKYLVKETREQTVPLMINVNKTSEEATTTLKKAQSAITNIEHMTGDDSAMAYRLAKTLNELELAARSLRLLTETLEVQPESIIFGKKHMRRN